MSASAAVQVLVELLMRYVQKQRAEIAGRFADALLRDYPLINRLDEYREVGDAKFLKALHDSETFHGNTDRKFD